MKVANDPGRVAAYSQVTAGSTDTGKMGARILLESEDHRQFEFDLESRTLIRK